MSVESAIKVNEEVIRLARLTLEVVDKRLEILKQKLRRLLLFCFNLIILFWDSVIGK